MHLYGGQSTMREQLEPQLQERIDNCIQRRWANAFPGERCPAGNWRIEFQHYAGIQTEVTFDPEEYTISAVGISPTNKSCNFPIHDLPVATGLGQTEHFSLTSLFAELFNGLSDCSEWHTAANS